MQPGSSLPWLGLALFATVTGGAGLLSGRLLVGAPAPASVVGTAHAVRVSDSGVCPPARVGGLDASLRGELRDVLREEVRAALAERSGDASATETAAAEPSAESLEALEKAHAIVDAALQAGRWTESDAQALRAVRVRLTTPQLEEVYAVLFPALNKGEIARDLPGPPM